MSAFKGAFKEVNVKYRPLPEQFWHQTPKWHWRYWVGHRMRRLVEVGLFHSEVEWKYRTFGEHARRVLEKRYDREEGYD